MCNVPVALQPFFFFTFCYFFFTVVRQMKERQMGKGMKWRDENGGGWGQVSYAADTVLVNLRGSVTV